MKRLLSTLPLIMMIGLHAQVTPPCANDYGSNEDAVNISNQMRYGTVSDAAAAIDQAKNTRGTSLGCPQTALPYRTPDTSEPLLADIATVWENVHAPSISAYIISCPRIGRYESNAALGAYYAMQAGYFKDTAKLAGIADMMVDQQYAQWNISPVDPRNEGVYGYIHTADSDMCYPGGVVGSSVRQVCEALPAYCVTYAGGQFSGSDFLVSGQDDVNKWFDGGLAYDHGWVGVQMIEAAIMQPDRSLKQKYRNSAVLAGQYAISEHCVKNHNYTAKLIWLLSELYAWTGNTEYKDELDYKLNKNLIPGILWDQDNDGFVDGTSPAISFHSLTSTARMPGRMWDGHNAVTWYHAMNTWAMTEAYAAFRDRGDTARAGELKPYAVAMLDNLADEILSQGVLATNALGVRDITYALLIGIWKLSYYENEQHPSWEQAAWAMWNTGYFNVYNTNSVCVGLYLLVKSESPYIPLAHRESLSVPAGHRTAASPAVTAHPNPADGILSFKIDADDVAGLSFKIIDIQGRTVQQGPVQSNNMELDINGLASGIFSCIIFNRQAPIYSFRMVK